MKRPVMLLTLAAVVFTMLTPPAFSLSWDPAKPRYVDRPDLEPDPVTESDPWDVEKSAPAVGGQVIFPNWWLELGQRLIIWLIADDVAVENTNDTGITVEGDDVRTGNTTANSASGAGAY